MILKMSRQKLRRAERLLIRKRDPLVTTNEKLEFVSGNLARAEKIISRCGPELTGKLFDELKKD